jgi:hypothetical protein
MGLSSVAGVFSRYFVVGFFLPAFFTLIALVHMLDESFLPAIYNESGNGAQVAIVGGAALLAGLLLLGLSYPILRLYEGYPLRARGSKWPVKSVYTLLLARQRKRHAQITARCKDEDVSEARQFDASWRLDREFPADEPDLLLPTAFGNATRAAERHSFTRWHLNSIAIWPHVENLLSSQEAQVLADARGDVAFFLNFSLLTLLSTPIIIADRLANDSDLSALLGFLPLALSVLTYTCATGAAKRLGEVIRAGIDLHRREIYTKLGLRTPKDFTDERMIAWHLNNTLLIGKHLPDNLADRPVVTIEHQGAVEVRPNSLTGKPKETPDDARDS